MMMMTMTDDGDDDENSDKKATGVENRVQILHFALCTVKLSKGIGLVFEQIFQVHLRFQHFTGLNF